MSQTLFKPIQQLVCVIMICLLFGSHDLLAKQQPSILDKYITDDVVAVGLLDLSKIQPSTVLQELQKMGVVTDEDKQRMTPSVDFAQQNIQALVKSGITRVYVLIRLSDLAEGGPTLIIPVAKDADFSQALQQWKQATAMLPPLKVGQNDQMIFAAGSDQQLERLTKPSPETSRDLSDAMASISDCAVGWVVCGDEDSRQVARSLLPNMPPPFESITGKLLADDLKWGTVKINLPPETSLKISLQANSEQSAQRILAALTPALENLSQLPEVQTVLPDKIRSDIFAALKPEKTDSLVSMSLDKVTKNMDQLAQAMLNPLQRLRESARRTQELNNLRQLMLAMHNYESANNAFPRAAGKSKQHPAGLSWRVHLLPYLNQQKLYAQFKLDEPWDSEHNVKLVQAMPALYQSTMPEYVTANKEGRTNYLVPVGPEAIFHKDADSEALNAIIDGTSNTIMIVSAAADASVIWTKPDDWHYDLQNPLKGLTAEGRKLVPVAFADGSVHTMPSTVDPKVLRALLTFAGGEVVQPEF